MYMSCTRVCKENEKCTPPPLVVPIEYCVESRKYKKRLKRTGIGKPATGNHKERKTVRESGDQERIILP